MAVRLPDGEKSGETTGQYLRCPLGPRGRECWRRPRVCGCLGPASVLPGRGVISNTCRGCNPNHSQQEHPKPGKAAPATSLAAPSLQAPHGALGSRPHHTWPLFVQSPRWGGGGQMANSAIREVGAQRELLGSYGRGSSCLGLRKEGCSEGDTLHLILQAVTKTIGIRPCRAYSGPGIVLEERPH